MRSTSNATHHIFRQYKLDVNYLKRMKTFSNERKKRAAALSSITTYKPLFGIMDEDDANELTTRKATMYC